jgi:hypothetical protein
MLPSESQTSISTASMLNFENFTHARWSDLYNFFAAGDPPLAQRLLMINTVFLVLFIIRQSRAKYPMRPTTAYAVQAILITANAAIMFHKDLSYWANWAHRFF